MINYIGLGLLLCLGGYLFFRILKRYRCRYCKCHLAWRYSHTHSNGGGLGPGGTDFYRKCNVCDAEEHRREVINIGSSPWEQVIPK